MSISRYIKLISLQENKNGFKGVTFENRNFECLTSGSNVVFLVSGVEIFRKTLDKRLTNWIDYKEIAKDNGLTLDDEGVTIPLPPSSESKKKESSQQEVKISSKAVPKGTTKAAAKSGNKTAKTSTKKLATKK